LTGRFYFHQATKTTEPSKVAPARLSAAAEAWSLIKETTSMSALEAYMSRFADTFYAELARQRLLELNQQQVARPRPTPCDGFETSLGGEARCLRPGDAFRDCPECPEMVVVPAGAFMMGSPEGEAERGIDEGLQRKVTLAKPFAVGKFEATFAEWDACVAAGACKHNPRDQGWGRGKHPVINVSWDDITKEYLPWLSRHTGQRYRLLTEAEWEYAARAGTTTPFSTGRTITTEQANFDGNRTYGGSLRGQYRRKSVEVGSFGPNAFGLHDMHGNVWEWVEDCYKDSYAGAAVDGNAAPNVSGCARVLRGGSWNSGPGGDLRSANRRQEPPATRTSLFGFRVVRDP